MTWRGHVVRAAGISLLVAAGAVADDGYRLWLRYDLVEDAAARRGYAEGISEIVVPASASATIGAARDELVLGLRGLLGVDVPVVATATRDHSLVLGAAGDASTLTAADLRQAGDEGFVLRRVARDGGHRIVIAANRDVGVLHGAFALLRHLQLRRPLDGLNLASAPKVQRRLLNHWDNLDRTVERGYSGASIWEWFYLPQIRSPRYRDYARACASLGINGAVVTNVNANAQILTPFYLERVAALADELRPYGVRLYLSARFSAPMEIGGLKTSDPLDAAVGQWWRRKIDEVYRYVPDFGGFIVKANSEGQPGPQDYKRTHADGANMLADALAPHGGIVMWRAFVYSPDNVDDRVKQAQTEFQPLDGQFRDNVVLQIKNGPLDFMPREPFSPMFAHMPKTRLGLELQVTQEYLGQSIQIAYLGGMWKEVLDADTYANGPGSTVARIVDGSLRRQHPSLIAGVANVGSDRNWTGHLFAQANWYAFGRLAWDHELSAEAIADEWTRQTFGHDAATVSTREPDAHRLARGGGELLDAAGPAPHHGRGAPLRARSLGGQGGPRGLDVGLLPPRGRAGDRVRPHRDGLQRHRTVRAGMAEGMGQPGHLPGEPAALVPPRRVGPQDGVRADAVGRAGDPLPARRRRGASDAEGLGLARGTHRRRSGSRTWRSGWRGRSSTRASGAMRACSTSSSSRSGRCRAGVEPPEHPLEVFVSKQLRNMPGHR